MHYLCRCTQCARSTMLDTGMLNHAETLAVAGLLEARLLQIPLHFLLHIRLTCCLLVKLSQLNACLISLGINLVSYILQSIWFDAIASSTAFLMMLATLAEQTCLTTDHLLYSVAQNQCHFWPCNSSWSLDRLSNLHSLLSIPPLFPIFKADKSNCTWCFALDSS